VLIVIIDSSKLHTPIIIIVKVRYIWLILFLDIKAVIKIMELNDMKMYLYVVKVNIFNEYRLENMEFRNIYITAIIIKPK
jgi:hypothetical protein